MFDHVRAYHHTWYWQPIMRGMDWPAVRRGRLVYSELLAASVPIRGVRFRDLGAFMTVEEIQRLANSYTVSEKKVGSTVVRAATADDPLPRPPCPCDLDLQSMAKHEADGYSSVYGLLIGFGHNGDQLATPPRLSKAPLPAGVYWNPFVKGCTTTLPPLLSDGAVEYDDGTPATRTQMAKDFCCFLKWTNDRDLEERRVMLLKVGAAALIATCLGSHLWTSKFTVNKIFARRKFRHWKPKFFG